MPPLEEAAAAAAWATGTTALRGALRALGALPAEQVIWKPQSEGDSISRDEIALDYPDLRVL